MSKFKVSKLTASQIGQLPADLQDAIADIKAGSSDFNDAAYEALADIDQQIHTMATNQLAMIAVKTVKAPAKAAPAPKAKAAPKAAPKVKAPKPAPAPKAAAPKAKADKAAPKADATKLRAQRAAKLDQTTRTDRVRNMSREEVLAAAREFNSLRTLGGQMVDNASTHKKVLDPTPENLVRWMRNPGRFDIRGVDAPRAADATANLKKPDSFWKRLGF
jgi:hypothetical protein